jgi:hypothetical protein
MPRFKTYGSPLGNSLRDVEKKNAISAFNGWLEMDEK